MGCKDLTVQKGGDNLITIQEIKKKYMDEWVLVRVLERSTKSIDH